MDISGFNQLADSLLSEVLDRVDEVAGDMIDADLHGGILTMTFEDGRQFILNKNAHLFQLWLSSPVSGAWHFHHDGGEWRSTRGGNEPLRGLLASELSAASGRTIAF